MADENNLRNLLRDKPGYATAEVKLWGSYLDGKRIDDPYYGNIVSLGFHSAILAARYLIIRPIHAEKLRSRLLSV